jgi:hypothetical protein
MKDLFEQILKYLPHYLTEFGAAFSGPKSFIATKLSTDAGDAFGEALLFLGISLTLVLLMYTPLLPAGKDFWSFAIPYVVCCMITLPLAAIVTRAAWWIVGGRASARLFFIAYAYYFGVANVLLAATDLVAKGFFKKFDPQLYREYFDALQKAQSMQNWSESYADLLHRFDQSNVALIFMFIGTFGYLILSIWGLIGWGALTSRTRRSALAPQLWRHCRPSPSRTSWKPISGQSVVTYLRKTRVMDQCLPVSGLGPPPACRTALSDDGRKPS